MNPLEDISTGTIPFSENPAYNARMVNTSTNNTNNNGDNYKLNKLDNKPRPCDIFFKHEFSRVKNAIDFLAYHQELPSTAMTREEQENEDEDEEEYRRDDRRNMRRGGRRNRSASTQPLLDGRQVNNFDSSSSGSEWDEDEDYDISTDRDYDYGAGNQVGRSSQDAFDLSTQAGTQQFDNQDSDSEMAENQGLGAARNYFQDWTNSNRIIRRRQSINARYMTTRLTSTSRGPLLTPMPTSTTARTTRSRARVQTRTRTSTSSFNTTSSTPASIQTQQNTDETFSATMSGEEGEEEEARHPSQQGSITYISSTSEYFQVLPSSPSSSIGSEEVYGTKEEEGSLQQQQQSLAALNSQLEKFLKSQGESSISQSALVNSSVSSSPSSLSPTLMSSTTSMSLLSPASSPPSSVPSSSSSSFTNISQKSLINTNRSSNINMNINNNNINIDINTYTTTNPKSNSSKFHATLEKEEESDDCVISDNESFHSALDTASSSMMSAVGSNTVLGSGSSITSDNTLESRLLRQTKNVCEEEGDVRQLVLEQKEGDTIGSSIEHSQNQQQVQQAQQAQEIRLPFGSVVSFRTQNNYDPYDAMDEDLEEYHEPFFGERLEEVEDQDEDSLGSDADYDDSDNDNDHADVDDDESISQSDFNNRMRLGLAHRNKETDIADDQSSVDTDLSDVESLMDYENEDPGYISSDSIRRVNIRELTSRPYSNINSNGHRDGHHPRNPRQNLNGNQLSILFKPNLYPFPYTNTNGGSSDMPFKMTETFFGPPVAPIHYHLRNNRIHFQDLGCLLLGFNQFGRPIVGLKDSEYISASMVYAFATMLYECINSPFRDYLSCQIQKGEMSPYQFVCALGRHYIFQDYLRCVQWHELDRIFPVHQYRFVMSTFYHADTFESSISMQTLEQFLCEMST